LRAGPPPAVASGGWRSLLGRVERRRTFSIAAALGAQDQPARRASSGLSRPSSLVAALVLGARRATAAVRRCLSASSPRLFRFDPPPDSLASPRATWRGRPRALTVASIGRRLAPPRCASRAGPRSRSCATSESRRVQEAVILSRAMVRGAHAQPRGTRPAAITMTVGVLRFGGRSDPRCPTSHRQRATRCWRLQISEHGRYGGAACRGPFHCRPAAPMLFARRDSSIRRTYQFLLIHRASRPPTSAVIVGPRTHPRRPRGRGTIAGRRRPSRGVRRRALPAASCSARANCSASRSRAARNALRSPPHVGRAPGPARQAHPVAASCSG